VPFDHPLQRRQEAVQSGPALETQQSAHYIGISVLQQQVMKQDALLQRRQRIDVLHVPRAAFHPGDDGVERGLLEQHEGQHLGRDALCLSGNRRRRHGCLVARAFQP
jgi:hypothetical protein